MPYYRRRTPELWEEIAAVAAGVAAGLAAHYLTRTLLRRAPLPGGDTGPEPGERPSASADRPGGRATTGASR
jgi:hypothetical protein